MSMIGRAIGGCGCLFFLVAVAGISFWAGCEYGPKLKQEIRSYFHQQVDEAKEKIAEADRAVKADLQKRAHDAAGALTGEKKPSSDDEKNKK